MKSVITGTLLLVLLSGCQSTSDNEVAQTTANEEVITKQLTDAELEKMAKNTSFTRKQLKAAAETLGYRCEMVARTGSHMKKKLCSTKQQRDIKAQASKQLLADMNRTAITAASLNSNGG